MTKLRIFLADDHAVMREGLKRLIEDEADMKVVGESGNGRQTLERAVALKPDVIVMDVSMPELNGAQVTRRLKPLLSNTAVLALTLHEDRSYVRELLEAGAAGYILKRTAADELIRAIRTVAAGDIYVDKSLTAQLVNSFVLRKTSPGGNAELSEREEAVLRLIARGYSNKEIGARLNLSVKTVETYKARSMEKLNLQSRVDIVRYANDLGWLREH